MNFPIDWPPLPDHDNQPVWTGHGFRVGEEIFPFLVYELGDSGWSDDLANLVAKEVDDDRPIRKASRSRTLEELKRWLSTNIQPVILDVGCSTGSTINAIRSSIPTAFTIGAEYVVPPLAVLATNMPDIPLIQLDLVRSPLPDQSFDAIIILNVLEHIEDDGAALAQIYRMLRPGGIAIIEVPAMPKLYDIYDKHVGHFRRYRMKDLLSDLRDTGFEVLSYNHLGIFIFPVFWLYKKRNQRFFERSEDEQKDAVVGALRSANKNWLLDIFFKLEAVIYRWIYIPFGIRCTVTCQRPMTSKE